MNPHREFREVDRLEGRERQLAALKSAETLVSEAHFRILGSGLMLTVAGLPKDAPSIAALAAARRSLRDAWDLITALAATAEEAAGL